MIADDLAIHLSGRPDASRPTEDELLIQLDTLESGRLSVGRCENGPHDWVTQTDDREAWFVRVLDALEKLADGRKLTADKEGVYTLAIDAETNEVQEVWAFGPWIREAVTTEDIETAIRDPQTD